MKFDNGPAIAVQITLSQGSPIGASLALSDTFTCLGATAPLLDWFYLYTKGLSLPLPFPQGTSFEEEVYQTMQKIPFGVTLSYGELALLSGHPKAARAVGNACNRNRFPLLVPCHRVVYSNGTIGGFAVDLEIKRRLLEFEASLSLTCPKAI